MYERRKVEKNTEEKIYKRQNLEKIEVKMYERLNIEKNIEEKMYERRNLEKIYRGENV